MIERYRHPEMHEVWSEKSTITSWLEVEAAVLQAQIQNGDVPRKEGRLLHEKLLGFAKKKSITPERVSEIERTTKHDVLAFTQAVTEKLGPEGRWLHFGLTSSDVVDTALSLRIQRAGELIVKELKNLIQASNTLAKKTKKTPALGRTHGMAAEPTIFGLRFLGAASAFGRDLERITRALEGLRVGKLSGAVGVNSHIEPKLEAKILKALGLDREPVSTQVLPRDRHAEMLSALAIFGANIERLATELRHLQRTEVSEVMEGFSSGQKGSSAMPHKRNPISAENLCGCARLLRGYAIAEMESVALWHERDISHSSVERVVFPDAFELTHYALKRMTELLKKLEIHPSKISENLKSAGDQLYSGHLLLELVRRGHSREKAYAWIQACAHGKNGFLKSLVSHPEISKEMKPAEIKKLLHSSHQFRNVGAIYSEVVSPARQKLPKRN